jgi:hypothetical protein
VDIGRQAGEDRQGARHCHERHQQEQPGGLPGANEEM